MSKENISPSRRLKLATAEKHQKTEKLLGLDKTGSSAFAVANFDQLVVANNYIWSGFYLELSRQEVGWWKEYQPLVETLVAAAAQDFSNSGVVEPAAMENYPAIKNEPEMAGSLYVHLGSLLGARFIHRALRENSGLVDCRPFHFYSGGELFTRADWRLFTDRLDEVISDPLHLEVATQQANKVFGYFQKSFVAAGVQEG